MAGRVYLIRHGETEWSETRRHTGRTDIELTELGRTRAKALAPVLAAVPGIDTAAVFTSPLRRARQTCELAGLGDRAEVWADLAEWDYGEYEGTRTSDLRASDPTWSIWTADVREGESLADVAARVDRVIARLDTILGTAGDPVDPAAAADDTGGVADGRHEPHRPPRCGVALFAHAHVLRILAARWCGFSPRDGERLTLLPASVSVLGFERETKVIEHWNAAGFPR